MAVSFLECFQRCLMRHSNRGQKRTNAAKQEMRCKISGYLKNLRKLLHCCSYEATAVPLGRNKTRKSLASGAPPDRMNYVCAKDAMLVGAKHNLRPGLRPVLACYALWTEMAAQEAVARVRVIVSQD